MLLSPLLSSLAKACLEAPSPHRAPRFLPSLELSCPGRFRRGYSIPALECAVAPPHPSSRALRIGETPGPVRSFENRRRQAAPAGGPDLDEQEFQPCSNKDLQGDLGRWFPLSLPQLAPPGPRKELRPHSSKGGWREKGPPPSLPRPSPCVGFGLSLPLGVAGSVPNKGWRWPRAQRGCRCGAGGSRRPFGSVPHRFPAQYAPLVHAARKPWQGPHSPPPEQPARSPACLIRSSLTSSAKLSQVNPISSNHSIWHVFLVFVRVFFLGGGAECTLSRNVWDNNLGTRTLNERRPVCSSGRVPVDGFLCWTH